MRESGEKKGKTENRDKLENRMRSSKRKKETEAPPCVFKHVL